MGYLDTGEIFKNMLQLKRFGLYFEGIMNRKWLLSYRNNDIKSMVNFHFLFRNKLILISYRDARGFGSILPEKILQ